MGALTAVVLAVAALATGCREGGPGAVTTRSDGAVPRVPDFTGMPLSRARARARALGIATHVGWSVQREQPRRVVPQFPPPGYPDSDLTGSMALYASTGLMATGRSVAEFRSTAGAAYCQLDTANDLDVAFVCWRPRDGMRADIGSGEFDYPGRAWREDAMRGARPAGFRTIGPGGTWRRHGIVCVVGSAGLSCRNPMGHGFWLGRVRGVRRF